jgi:hypothetical protein
MSAEKARTPGLRLIWLLTDKLLYGSDIPLSMFVIRGPVTGMLVPTVIHKTMAYASR